MERKQCPKCGEVKDPAGFYPNDRTCKECRKSAAKAHRAANSEHYKAYDRARANRPDRVALRKKYQKTGAFRESHSKASLKWRTLQADRRAAHIKLGNAIRDGKIERLPCFVCGAANSEAHHADYSAPLAVTWLCDQHHKETHKLARELERKAA